MNSSFLESPLALLSMALLSLGLLLCAALLVRRERHVAQGRKVIERAVLDGLPRAAGESRAADPAVADAAPRNDQDLPGHWLQTRWGRVLVGDEDRRLIEQCGGSSVRLQLRLLVARLGLALLLPLAGWLLIDAGLLPRQPMVVPAIAFTLGFMAPKWWLARRAGARREQAAHELPLLVDLLRLLQGVGLSLDQSLQIIGTDFDEPLPLLGPELASANRHYGQGRTRDHSLQRLATVYLDEDLAALVALLVQLDRHGGAVQEPLAQFGARLREQRRSELKSRIGKITVKMTGVMVATLLPALVIVTAGPGFLAVTRSLGAMAK